jgi:hypothetical protein
MVRAYFGKLAMVVSIINLLNLGISNKEELKQISELKREILLQGNISV